MRTLNTATTLKRLSAVIILGRIAKTIAEYDTQLWVPTSKSLVMTTARETVKEAYTAAGRPDAYSDDIVTYLTDDQFGYVSGVNGIMVRDKPATCLYLGAFYAERGELQDALGGKDTEPIKQKLEALKNVLQEVSTTVYQQVAQEQARQAQASQAGAAGASEANPAGGSPEEGKKEKVVDADYRVVDEEKK